MDLFWVSHLKHTKPTCVNSTLSERTRARILMSGAQRFSKNHDFYIFITWGYCIAIGHLYTSECDSYWSSQTMQCTTILHADSSAILQAEGFLLYLYWPLIVTLLRVQNGEETVARIEFIPHSYKNESRNYFWPYCDTSNNVSKCQCSLFSHFRQSYETEYCAENKDCIGGNNNGGADSTTGFYCSSNVCTCYTDNDRWLSRGAGKNQDCRLAFYNNHFELFHVKMYLKVPFQQNDWQVGPQRYFF